MINNITPMMSTPAIPRSRLKSVALIPFSSCSSSNTALSAASSCNTKAEALMSSRTPPNTVAATPAPPWPAEDTSCSTIVATSGPHRLADLLADQPVRRFLAVDDPGDTGGDDQHRAEGEHRVVGEGRPKHRRPVLTEPGECLLDEVEGSTPPWSGHRPTVYVTPKFRLSGG